MPRKTQGWITFQSSEEERQILERICQRTQRTKTDVLREMIRQLEQSSASTAVDVSSIELSDDLDPEADDAALDEGNESGQAEAMHAVQLSARNILKAKVKRVVRGTVNAEVTLTIAPGVELVSIVTRASADKLGLKQGKAVFAVVKSSSVMVAASP